MLKLVLIDGNSLLNRAFYATKLLTTKSGTPTNAVFGFVKLLLKLNSDIEPDRLIVAFDLKAPTFRHKMYDQYKATRKPMPEDLAVQLPILKSLLSSMKIAICEKEGYEANVFRIRTVSSLRETETLTSSSMKTQTFTSRRRA